MPQAGNGGQAGNALIWIDLEMTGLNTDTDRIIEIATIVTDNELNVLAEGPVLAVHQAEEVLQGMDDWNKRTHKATGLIERVRASTLTEAEAERLTLEFLQRHVPKNKSPMCGNSICQDRRFLARGMPDLEAWFHYRNLDVSTLKELVYRWKPEIGNGFQKKNTHKALDDIRESIEELKYYREHFIVK
jgi:oligoribonuclease